MNKCSIISLAVIFHFIPAAAAGYGKDIERIKLATWNIEWLNAKDNTGKVKRRSEDYAKLRYYTEKLNADIIALQEIDGLEGAGRVFDSQKYTFEFPFYPSF